VLDLVAQAANELLHEREERMRVGAPDIDADPLLAEQRDAPPVQTSRST
jgi:hypothetical protein